MASLVLGGIGQAFFGPVGGFIGGIAGSIIDQALFGPGDQVIENARVPDLKVSFSSTGKPIPILHGSDRLGSNVVMAPGLVETRHEEEQGGKGGPTVTTVSYSYTATFRCLFCEGVAEGAPQIWADGKILADLTGTDAATVAGILYEKFGPIVVLAGFAPPEANVGGRIRFYGGEETQEPDPAEEAIIGAGQTSAYRGLVTIVFEDLPLEDYGNRIPQITARIAMQKTAILPELQVVSDQDPWQHVLHSPNQEFALTWRETPPSSATLWSMRARAPLWVFKPASGEVAHADVTNDRVYLNVSSDLYELDILTGEILNLWTGVIQGDGFDKAKIIYTQKGEGLFANRYIVGLAHFGHLTIFHLGTNTVRYSVNIASLIPGIGGGNTSDATLTVDGGGDIWFTMNPTGTGPSSLVRVEPEMIPGTEAINFEVVEQIADPPIDVVDLMFYLPETGALIMAEPTGNEWHEYDLATRSFTGESVAMGTINRGDDSYYRARHGSINGRIWFHDGHQQEVDFISFQTLRDAAPEDWPTPTVGQNDGFYDPINHAIWCLESSPDTICFLDRESADLVSLQTVVEGLSSRAEADATRYGASDLAAILVGSHIYSGRSPIGGALDALVPIFGIRVREEDFALEWKRRTGTAVATIGRDDLGARSGFVGETFLAKIEPADELELPFKIDLNFNDPGLDYQVNTAEFSRAAEAVSARSGEVITYNGALDPADARKLVEVLGYSRWAMRDKIEWSAPLRHLLPSPADVVDLELEAETVPAEIDQVQLGANSVLSFKGRRFDAEAFVQSAIPGGLVESWILQSTTSAPLTDLQVGDLPALRDQDDGHGVYIWAGAIGAGAWPGAGVYQENAAGQFELIESFDSSQLSLTGVCKTTLPDGPLGLWDRAAVLRVDFRSGTPVSRTEAEVLADPTVNAALVGRELVQFTTAALVSGTTYDLSVFLRGRFGSDHERADHVGAERFALIDQAKWIRPGLVSGDIGLSKAWRGVTFNADFQSGITRRITYDGNGDKPLSPVHLRGVRGASPQDWTLSWTRRKRASWPAFWAAAVPLDEPTEEYEIEIMNGAAVANTYNGLGSSSYTWTEAQQTADLGSLQSAVTFRVYQINSEGRRGFVAEKTIDSTL